MEGFDKKENGSDREEIYSKSVRAGKRTYFFDVKATKKNEFYLTITESKKHYETDGRFNFEKHKLFLYKEDFEKFVEGLNEVVEYIRTNQPETESSEELDSKGFTDVEFEDLHEKR